MTDGPIHRCVAENENHLGGSGLVGRRATLRMALFGVEELGSKMDVTGTT